MIETGIAIPTPGSVASGDMGSAINGAPEKHYQNCLLQLCEGFLERSTSPSVNQPGFQECAQTYQPGNPVIPLPALLSLPYPLYPLLFLG